MPRNSSGVYSLPPTNPVVPFTTITTAWANPTLADIANALTDSLSRSGLGGMTSPFLNADGNVSNPGAAFANETGLGIFRLAAGQMNMASGGNSIFGIAADKAISFLKMEHRGNGSTYKTPGAKSWRINNVASFLIFTPSATIDAEDWDLTKSVTISEDGDMSVPGVFTFGSSAIADLQVTNDLEAKKVIPITYVAGSISGAYNLNFANGYSQILTLVGAATLTPINVPVGALFRIVLIATNNAVSWAASVKWPEGVVPNLATGSLKRAIVVLEYDGTNYLASSASY